MPEIKAIDFILAAVMRPHLVRSDHPSIACVVVKEYLAVSTPWASRFIDLL